jgi:hypothetical protein
MALNLMMSWIPVAVYLKIVETRDLSCLTLVLAAQPIPTDTVTSLNLMQDLVDPARGHCYRGPTKPCESNAARHGGLLSNTWITYPWVGHKPGKLGIMPDRSGRLECVQIQSSDAQGWVCGLSGCSGCNVPTSLKRVRVVRARARRWILRHESRPYGVQQARNLYNAGNRDKGTSSADI